MVQTSVEWIIEQLTPSISLQQKYIDELKEKANKIHNQEVVNTFKDAQVMLTMNDETRADQYYYERFKKK